MCEYVRPTHFVDFTGEESKYLPQDGEDSLASFVSVALQGPVVLFDARLPAKILALIMNLKVDDY